LMSKRDSQSYHGKWCPANDSRRHDSRQS
jgi:hypothetical protein